MPVVVDQNIEEYGIFRTLTGTLVAADHNILLNAQNAVATEGVRYIINDVRGVSETDDDWPLVFSRLHTAASTYAQSLHMFFISDNPVLYRVLHEYAGYLKEFGWACDIMSSEQEVRAYIAEHILPNSA